MEKNREERRPHIPGQHPESAGELSPRGTPKMAPFQDRAQAADSPPAPLPVYTRRMGMGGNRRRAWILGYTKGTDGSFAIPGILTRKEHKNGKPIDGGKVPVSDSAWQQSGRLVSLVRGSVSAGESGG